MTADPNGLRFYFDESALGVGKALTIARRDVVHCGHPLVPFAPLGARDIDWMPEVAARNLIVVARDRHIRTKPAELAVLRDYGLRVLWIAGKRDLSNWDALVRLVRRWEGIERSIDSLGPGPWFIAVHDSRLAVIPVP